MLKPLLIACIILSLLPAEGKSADHTSKIYIATYRGCEETCEAFRKWVIKSKPGTSITIGSANMDRTRIPRMAQDIRALKPNLLVTWGTIMTLGLVGGSDGASDPPPISDIPTVYMYVADAKGAGIIAQDDFSGRPNLTGTQASLPYETQFRVMRMYHDVNRLAGIFNPAEINSVIAARNLRDAAQKAGITALTVPLSLDETGKPRDGSIGEAVGKVAQFAPDFLVHLSSSHVLLARKELFRHTMAHGIPMFSSTDLPIIDGDAVLGALTPLQSIGEAAAQQALKVLEHKGRDLSHMPIPPIPKYEIVINMAAARRLNLLPPPTLLRLARIVD